MYSSTCRLLLYSKTIACSLCSVALHLSICTVQPYRSLLQQCIVGWEEPPSKTQAAMHSTTMAHWYQLHHNFITSSSLWILLTLTFYRDWQHRGRDAWQCQHLSPFRFRLLFNSWSRCIVICWWSVVFIRTKWCELWRIPAVTVGLHWEKRRGGLKKQEDGETSKWQSVQGCVWMMAGILFW